MTKAITGTSNQSAMFSSGRSKRPAAPKATPRKKRPSQIPALPPARHAPPRWAHQEETLEFVRTHPRVLDTSDPGTGKTRGHLEAFAERYAVNKKAALVVAPKSLLDSAWYQDAKKFTPHLMCSLAYAHNRAEAFEAVAAIYVINTDGVKWLAQQPKRFFWRFDTLLIDELSTFKHRTSQRSKAIAKIRDRFQYRAGLTGTPNSGTILDVWHQAFILDDGERLGSNFFQFRNATCTPEQVGPKIEHIKWVDKPGAEAAVASLLADITIRHKFEDCMDIPPNHLYYRSFKLSPKALAAYRKMEEEAVLELRSGVISAVNAAVLRNKLLQIASGAVYGSEDHEHHLIDKGRYELIADLVAEVEHSVTFFNWTHQKEELGKLLTARNIPFALIDGTVPVKQRTELVKQYQAGKFQTLLLHPQTGAHGLTLTKGTRTIWSSPVYQPDFLKQGTHRIYRGGQTHKTETILVEAENTVESLVYKKLNDKNQRMLNLLEILEENSHEK